MAQRLCGYCRDIGHQRPKCPKLHAQRKELREHIPAEIKNIYNYLCSKGFGPNALVDWNVLRWGSKSSRPPLLAQILPYDYEVPRRYYNGTIYKSTFSSVISGNLFNTKHVKYSKQTNVRHLKLGRDSIYANIPVLLLDGSNNVEMGSLATFSIYQANLAAPTNTYAAGDGREIINNVFISPSYDCPEMTLPKEVTSPSEEFYPDRLRL